MSHRLAETKQLLEMGSAQNKTLGYKHSLTRWEKNQGCQGTMGLTQDPGTPLNAAIFSTMLNQTLCLFKIVHKDVLMDK